VLGWIISRSRLRIRHALDFVSLLSVGIPAVIAGLGVMLLYLSLPIGLYGTVWILVLAYSYRFATTTRLARAGFLQIHRELEEASATSGARWLATQRRVLVPLMLPALSAGFILLFIVGVREFTIPLVLYSQDNVVLSVLLWQLFQSGQAAASAALASIIIAVVLPVVFIARRLLARGTLAD
jgi:iron(III) transport system permease protein